jgi:glycosyltransferase involved in cell wall biosynthesis
MARVLLITSHDFWSCTNGSRQRISELVLYFAGQHDFHVLYVGDDPVGEHQLERLREQYSLSSISVLNSLVKEVPQRRLTILHRLVVKITTIIDHLWAIIRRRLRMKSSSVSDQPKSIQAILDCLACRLPPKPKDIRRILNVTRPNIVILEYLRLHTYLHAIRRLMPSTKILIDTHDVLSDRCTSFMSYGYPHWCSLSAKDEARLLNGYDGIIAINRRDRDIFSKMVSEPRIILAGHPASQSLVRASRASTPNAGKIDNAISILFLASGGWANLDALDILLHQIMPLVQESSARKAKLLIAGSVCSDLHAIEMIGNSRLNCITVIGCVDNLDHLYINADIVSNPVRFGGGLKIKNIEAMSAGLALITSPEGASGLPITDPPSFYIADNPDDHVRYLLDLIHHPNKLFVLRQRAAEAARNHLSPESVYMPLNSYLHSPISN